MLIGIIRNFKMGIRWFAFRSSPEAERNLGAKPKFGSVTNLLGQCEATSSLKTLVWEHKPLGIQRRPQVNKLLA
jgi:hypothetical protein